MPLAPSPDPEQLRRTDQVRAYHHATAHRFEAYAKGPGTLDWDAQPAPFRRYPGSPARPLPRVDDLLGAGQRPELSAALERDFASLGGAMPSVAPDIASLGALLHLSFGLTAWKRLGPERWALRANPSSGNLHPVEAWVICAGIDGLADGVHHYRPEDHALECRASDRSRGRPRSLHIALSSAMWREAWKYGERAFRYCQLDVGHALGALGYAAALLGWRLRLDEAIDHATLTTRLGLDRGQDYPARREAFTEREEAELALRIDGGGLLSNGDPAAWRHAAALCDWHGRASELDPHPRYRWPVVERIAEATRSGGGSATAAAPVPMARPPVERSRASSPPARAVILGRRSAQRFDAEHVMPRGQFIRMLDALCASDLAPLDVLPDEREIALVFFVHRVQGLDPGVYVMPRHGRQGLVHALAARFPKLRQPGPIAGSTLHCLAGVEALPLRHLTRSLHCHQDIAASGNFAVALLTDLELLLHPSPGRYRTAHRAAGLLGQVLYLEAEAAGLRGTGIGCFFDEPVRDALGLAGSSYYSLYHFTVGRAIDDPRIETTPAYADDRLHAFAEERPPC